MNNELEIREIKIPLHLYRLIDYIWEENKIFHNLIESLNRDIEKRILVRTEVLEILSHKAKNITDFKKNEFNEVYQDIERKTWNYTNCLQSLSDLRKRDFSTLNNQVSNSLDNKRVIYIPREFLRILNLFYNQLFDEFNHPITHIGLPNLDKIIQNDVVEIITPPQHPMNRLLRFEYSLEDWLTRALSIEISDRASRVFRSLNSVNTNIKSEATELKKLNLEQEKLSRYRLGLLKLKDKIEVTKKKINSMAYAMPNLANIITRIYRIEKKSELHYAEFEDPRITPDPGEIFYQEIQNKLKRIIKNKILEYDMPLNFAVSFGDQGQSTQGNTGSV